MSTNSAPTGIKLVRRRLIQMESLFRVLSDPRSAGLEDFHVIALATLGNELADDLTEALDGIEAGVKGGAR